MGYEHLAISLHSRSGAQHWQRAALVIAILSGMLSGLSVYAFSFNRISIPITTDPTTIAISFHTKDARSHIGQELSGYIQTQEHLALQPQDHSSNLLINTQTGTIKKTTEQIATKSITSLWPTSYISYNSLIFPLRAREYGAQVLTHRQKSQKTESPTNKMSFLQMKDSPLVGLFSNLTVSRIEFNKEDQLITSGKGQENSFIELLSVLNRPILTKKTTLEDGTNITELRATPHAPAIETTGGISTYSSSQPFFLATHNKDSDFWALRNVPTKPVSPEITIPVPSTCPTGSIGSINKVDSKFFSDYKFVINILDKITLTKSGVHLCLSVDKL